VEWGESGRTVRGKGFLNGQAVPSLRVRQDLVQFFTQPPERSGGRPGDWPCGRGSVVEHHLAKVRVAGSNPVVRSEMRLGGMFGCGLNHAPAAEWPSGLGKGLQSPVHGFDSRLRLPRLCDRREHPSQGGADHLAVLATRSCVSSFGAHDITQGSPRRDLTCLSPPTGPRPQAGRASPRSASPRSSSRRLPGNARREPVGSSCGR
jgi:hypothetical protein